MVTGERQEESEAGVAPPELAESPPEDTGPLKPITYLNIAREFAWIGATSLGQGRQAYFYSAFVKRFRWMSNEEFADGLSLSQIVPGPNLANFSVYIGWLRGGWQGALIAWTALLTPGFLAILAAAWALSSDVPMFIQGALAGVAAVSVALLVMVVVQASPAACRRARGGWLILAATFVLAGPLKLGIVPVLIAMVTLSLILNRPR